MKHFLPIVSAVFLFNTIAFAQAPSITYTPASNSLSTSVPFYLSPTNAGGAVPATTYGQVTTFAGSTTGASGNFNNTGTAALFTDMEAIVGDANGNIYVAEFANNDIRKITPAGVVTTFAGSTSGVPGLVDNTGTSARFNGPDGLAIDASGNLFVSDYTNNAIRKITPAGVVSTFVTLITGASGLSFDNSGNLVAAEQDANQIIKISPTGVVTSIAGNFYGYANGTGSAALFKSPNDVQVDASTDNIYVADYLNNVIRKITPAGVVTTLAGGNPPSSPATFADGTGAAARFNNPTGVVLGAGGIIYVGDLLNNVIRNITPAGVVTTVAGSPGQSGTTDGAGSTARFAHPVDLYIDNTGTGYVIDGANNNIRKITLTGYSINPSLPAGLSFNSTTGIITGTPTGTFASTTYTITGYNASGYSATTVTLSCTTPTINNWTGSTSSDWANAGNWSLGHAPGATETAEIGITSYTAQPNLNGNTTVKSIVFGSNNNPALTIGSGTLTVTNNLIVNTSASVTINGPGTINISGNSSIFPTGSLTASLNAVVAPGASSTLINNGTFTLSSDANGSSSIAALPLGASITGNVNVQRFVQGNNDINKRGYRLISSAVYTGTDASGAHVFDLQYLTNSVYVSGAGALANGFNVTTTQNPSLYLFREDVTPPSANGINFTTGYNWKGVAKINNSPAYNIGTQAKKTPNNIVDTTTTIPIGNGILFFFRGDNKTAANLAFPSGAPQDVTLTQTGKLNSGTVNVKLWFANTGNNLGNNLSYTSTLVNSGTSTLRGGFTLVGNPYASAINWEKYNMNGANSSIYGGGNLPSTIYVFNVKSKQYDTYIPALQGDTTNLSPTGSTATGSASNMIASGQGFFVVASATGQTLSFRETAKTSTQPLAASLHNLMGKPKEFAATPQSLLRLKLSIDSINTDEVVIRFNNQANAKYTVGEDALDMGGSGALVSLSAFSSDSIKLAISATPFPGLQQVVIPISTDATASGTYQLASPQLDNLPSSYDIWLKDAFTNDSLKLAANATYPFTIDKTNPATFGSNRFTVVIRQNQSAVYQLLDFTANKIPTAPQVQVVWKTANEQNNTNFTVERSTDNRKTFDVLGGLQAADAGTYSFLDKHPVIGQNFYRLKQENINNTITYSKVVGVFYSDLSDNANNNKLNIYPNPVSNSINLAIAVTSNENTSYKIKFVNNSGFVVKEVTSSQPSWQGNISALMPGTYFIRVFDNKDQSLVGRTKFVKL